MKDDTPMYDPNEANYVQQERYHGGYHDRNSRNSRKLSKKEMHDESGWLRQRSDMNVNEGIRFKLYCKASPIGTPIESDEVRIIGYEVEKYKADDQLEDVDNKTKMVAVSSLDPRLLEGLIIGWQMIGWSHHGFDCQIGNTLVYEQVLCDNQNYGLDQHPYYSSSPPQQFYCCEEDVLSTQIPNPPVDLDTEESGDDIEEIFNKELFLRKRNTAHVIPQSITYTAPPPFLATMEPLDTLSTGDEVISTTPTRENDEFIKSIVDDLVPIPRESGDIDTLSTKDKEIDFNPSDLETIDSVPDLRIFNVPLGKDDSISRSFGVTISNPLFDFDDNYSLIIDNKVFDDNIEDLSSLDPHKATPLVYASILLVTPFPDPKQICLREVERFDPFFSLTQSGDMTWVMERSSYRFPHMPLPRQVAYSPKVVMYHYFHPNLILSDGYVLEPRSASQEATRVIFRFK
ncbi:hypothetical protein Tco_0198975 [Tanacetum coccineum]